MQKRVLEGFGVDGEKQWNVTKQDQRPSDGYHWKEQAPQQDQRAFDGYCWKEWAPQQNRRASDGYHWKEWALIHQKRLLNDTK